MAKTDTKSLTVRERVSALCGLLEGARLAVIALRRVADGAKAASDLMSDSQSVADFAQAVSQAEKLAKGIGPALEWGAGDAAGQVESKVLHALRQCWQLYLRRPFRAPGLTIEDARRGLSECLQLLEVAQDALETVALPPASEQAAKETPQLSDHAIARLARALHRVGDAELAQQSFRALPGFRQNFHWRLWCDDEPLGLAMPEAEELGVEVFGPLRGVGA